MFGRFKEDDGTCDSSEGLLLKGLEKIRQERWNFVAKIYLVNGYYVRENLWEFVSIAVAKLNLDL